MLAENFPAESLPGPIYLSRKISSSTEQASESTELVKHSETQTIASDVLIPQFNEGPREIRSWGN